MVKAEPRTVVRWIAILTLLPLMVLGLYGLAMQVYGAWRYDRAYFAPEYVASYNAPASVAKALETALQTGNRTLLAELQGRQPAAAKARPNLVFVMLQEHTDRYYAYLYLDRETYERYIYYVELVRGRYVATPPDAYSFLHSGRWIAVFVPAAVGWWVLELGLVLAAWIYRLSTLMRERMYGG